MRALIGQFCTYENVKHDQTSEYEVHSKDQRRHDWIDLTDQIVIIHERTYTEEEQEQRLDGKGQRWTPSAPNVRDTPNEGSTHGS